jgi:predicted TPR repeat methyltransferase
MKDPRDIRIAELFDGHWNRNYTASKLRTDPLYAALAQELRDTSLPLLVIGCGLGLSAFYLRSRGIDVPIHGLDYDARKIEGARRAAERGGFGRLDFSQHDARRGLPEHQGNVCILDILQFFDAAEQESLLELAVSRVTSGGLLLIRSGIRDDSRRFKITVAGDLLAKATRWMKAAPAHYPAADDFKRILAPFGSLEISPLWGRTPFNNHWITLRRS